jgi:DNA repair protein RadC
LLTPPAALSAGLRAALAIPFVPAVEVGWLAVPFILAHRSRRQGLRARWALAAVRPSSYLDRCAAACRFRSRAIPPDAPELVMQHDLFSSLDSFLSPSSGGSSLLVRDVAGQYRSADADEVLFAAQQLLAAQVRGSDVLSTPSVVKDFLRARLAHLPHEVFAVVHLDAQHRVIDYVEMFRGTVSQTSVYPREVVRDALKLNSSCLLLVHNHPSGVAEPSKADEFLTQRLKQAAALIDVRVLDHFIVAGSSVRSMAEMGLV